MGRIHLEAPLAPARVQDDEAAERTLRDASASFLPGLELTVGAIEAATRRGTMPTARLVASLIPVLSFLVASTAAAEGESSPPEHQLEVIGGLGYSFSMKNGQEGRGSGGFAAAEYVFLPRHVFSPRLYAGAVVTVPTKNSCETPSRCDVEAQIAFVGAKVRVMAPIMPSSAAWCPQRAGCRAWQRALP